MAVASDITSICSQTSQVQSSEVMVLVAESEVPLALNVRNP